MSDAAKPASFVTVAEAQLKADPNDPVARGIALLATSYAKFLLGRPGTVTL